MTRKIAIMVISLAKESSEEPSEEIEEEILKELNELRIPWIGNIEKVTILESDED